MPSLDSLPDVLTILEASAVLRLSRNAVYECIHRGEVPGMRLGRRLIVPKRALVAMLEGRDWKKEFPAADLLAKTQQGGRILTLPMVQECRR